MIRDFNGVALDRENQRGIIMRRTKNISIKTKRIATAVFAAALMMTSASATVLLNPMVVYAGQVDDNTDTSGTVDVSEGDHMTNNNGKIDENNGTIDKNNGAGVVVKNYGTITTNNGVVGNNRKNNSGLEGKIVTNNGIVAQNYTGLTNDTDDGNGIRTNNGTVGTNNDLGCIDDNKGAVHTNRGLINTNAGNDPTITIYDSYIAKGVHENEGTIKDNTGLVEENKRTGVVTNNRGTVTTSYGTVTNNRGKITTNDVTTINNILYTGKVDNNNGEITTNNGLVENNYGAIEKNEGNEIGGDGWTAVKGVKFNLEDGEITTNSGYVQQNFGTIDINDTTGYVNANYDGNRTDSHTAIIKVNKGSVNQNKETVTLNTGTINYNDGTVTNNFGDVGCCGEYQDSLGYHPITSYIVNQYDGVLTAEAAVGTERNDTRITNFFGGTINGDGFDVENNFSDQNIRATNQYRAVSFVPDEVSTEFSISYGTGFTEKTLMEPDGTDGDTRHYINVTNGNGSGTITITAEDGYEVKQSGQASVTGFDYTLTKQGNDCVLNITGYKVNSIELSPKMFGLVIEEIRQADPEPTPSPSPKPDSDPYMPEEETITVSDNKPMAVSIETKGEFNITYAHEIPFFGKGKLTPESFGGLTVSQGNATYKVTKIKINKKKHRIQITGLQGADKETVKKVKNETNGSKGLPFKCNPYYVRDTDKVTPKFKKSGDLKSIKVFIDGKDYKVKKDEYSYDSSKKQILFKGNNLNGSYSTK